MSWGAVTGAMKQGFQNEQKNGTQGRQNYAPPPAGGGYPGGMPTAPPAPTPAQATPAAAPLQVGQNQATVPVMSPIEQMLHAIMRRPQA